jgi:hypothetical protein
MKQEYMTLMFKWPPRTLVNEALHVAVSPDHLPPIPSTALATDRRELDTQIAH